VRSISVDIGQDKLSAQINDYLRLLIDGRFEKERATFQEKAIALYNLLITPIESLLERNAEIVIIPDKALNQLPFASLISPSSKKYLIEDRPILVAPSANLFLVSTNRALLKEKVTDEKILSIGNPFFDRAKFPKLVDLPRDVSLATEIAKFYRSSMVLVEQEAREATIRKELEKTDIVHFTTYYLADERTPLFSLIPLAKEKSPAPKDQDGVLHTYELYGLNLSHLRLAILGGCQTGMEKYYRGEGAISLARAFQGAGIPLVVASLWRVESDPMMEFMVNFHKFRKRGGLRTVEALQRAQIEMIQSRDHVLRNPFHWAAYIVIGGHASF